ncbi:MAG: pyridoxal-phosphate dependent enzyme, partial [Gammaproteobacteria bacterium]|nr:pyridoxal-phosphate dependent enzyme [Gammaproteobacteria bacterium]
MYEKIQKAVKQIEGVAHRTPVVTCSTLNEKLGAEIFFKCENLQRVGAFKFRGAYNSMSQLDDVQKKAGVIAYSSGNHGQAIACSGKLLNISTVVVMPNNAPAIKKQATKSYGAKVVEY